MTDAEKIDEGAIVDAKNDFEALNEWLEKIKQYVSEFEIKNPNRIYAGLALLSFGYFLGVRSDRKISWLLQGLSGAVFGYSSIQLLGDYLRNKDKNQQKKEPQKLENIKIIEPDGKQN